MTAHVKQHLIDPETCIRCNTCEETCPVDAITHDANNYVVKPEICQRCMKCIVPCPTGAIDNWWVVTRSFGIDEQSRLHLRSLDQHLGRLIEDLSRGRQEAVQDIRSEIKILTRTIAALAEEGERR